jgi:hypothetical protein
LKGGVALKKSAFKKPGKKPRMRRDAAVWLCRALLACGAAVGIRFGAPELTWPYCTVSDVLATSGGAILYASWVAAFGVWIATYASFGDAFTRAGLISLLAPLFPCPHGTPIELRHVPTAPLAYAALGGTYVAVMLVSLDQTDARRAWFLCVVFLATYIGGQPPRMRVDRRRRVRNGMDRTPNAIDFVFFGERKKRTQNI